MRIIKEISINKIESSNKLVQLNSIFILPIVTYTWYTDGPKYLIFAWLVFRIGFVFCEDKKQ
jgi:hypothetical protein